MNKQSRDDLEQLKELLRLWQRKRTFLEREQAIAASATVQFELRIRIEECQEKIGELQQRVKEHDLSGNWQHDYSLPPEVCQNQAELLNYLEIVIPRLREEFGFIEIKSNFAFGDLIFKFLTRKQSFDMSIGMANFRGEAFFMFAEFYQLNMDSLREFSSKCLKYVEQAAESDTKFWKPVYDFRLPSNLCFSVAVVDHLDDITREKVITENPLRYSLNPLWYQVPVVYELNSKQLYFYEQPHDWIDRFTGEIAWKELRKITKKTLSS